MAFTYNSGGKVTGNSSASPIQFNYTAGSNSKLVVLTICHIGASPTAVGTPTYDSNNMSQVDQLRSSQEGGTEIWYYLSPVAESKQISIPNSAADTITYTCSDYTNASYDASYDTGNGADNGDAADVPASVTSTEALEGVCVTCMTHGEKDQFSSITNGTSLHATPSIDEGSVQSGAAYSIESLAGSQAVTPLSAPLPVS